MARVWDAGRTSISRALRNSSYALRSSDSFGGTRTAFFPESLGEPWHFVPVSRFPIPTELELIAWARKKYSWRCWDFTVRHFISLLLRCRKNVLEKNLAPSTNQMRYARSEIRFLGNLAFKLHTLFALYGETNSELSTWNNNNRAMDALDGISFLLPYLKQNVQCTSQLWTAHYPSIQLSCK